MPITTAAQLHDFLEKEGYAPEVSGDSVFVALGGAEAPYTAGFTFNPKGQLQITCQLAQLGDFPEDQLAQISLAALDANMQISPYAFAVIGASEGDVDVDKCPLVLIDTLQALTFSSSILKFGLTAA